MVCATLNPRAAENTLAIIVMMPQRIVVVPRRRLELPRPNGHWHLKPARLPIPPPGLAIDLAENRVLSEGVRIATNAGMSNHFQWPNVEKMPLSLAVSNASNNLFYRKLALVGL